MDENKTFDPKLDKAVQSVMDSLTDEQKEQVKNSTSTLWKIFWETTRSKGAWGGLTQSDACLTEFHHPDADAHIWRTTTRI